MFYFHEVQNVNLFEIQSLNHLSKNTAGFFFKV